MANNFLKDQIDELRLLNGRNLDRIEQLKQWVEALEEKVTFLTYTIKQVEQKEKPKHRNLSVGYDGSAKAVSSEEFIVNQIKAITLR